MRIDVESIEFRTFNDLFKNGFNNFRYTNKNKLIHSEIVKDLTSYREGSQGESNEKYEVYDVNLPDGWFIKLRLGSDSYGYNEFVENVSFVRGKEKKVTIYEF